MAKKSKGFPDTCQEKFLQEGAPYATNALPMDDPNITDRHLSARPPYGGSYNPMQGEFEHDATKREGDLAKGDSISGIIVHVVRK